MRSHAAAGAASRSGAPSRSWGRIGPHPAVWGRIPVIELPQIDLNGAGNIDLGKFDARRRETTRGCADAVTGRAADGGQG